MNIPIWVRAFWPMLLCMLGCWLGFWGLMIGVEGWQALASLDLQVLGVLACAFGIIPGMIAQYFADIRRGY